MPHFIHRGIAIWAALFVLLVALPSVHADYIRDFDARIRLLPDASLDVTESITVEFESPRHGIYRIIPVRYERYKNRYSVEFRLKSITDENGRSLHYSQSSMGRDINLKIGDADVTLTGEHVYRINYTVRRAVNFFGESPEVYWNATGDQWPYQIQKARATLTLPDGVIAAQVKTACFVGPPGSTERGEIVLNGQEITYSAAGVLPAGSGMTMLAGLPGGVVKKPGAAQELLWFIFDWWPLVGFPAIALAIAYWRWSATGRDEGAGTQAVGVEFEPPKDLTPAEVGTLIDESCDTPDIVATLIDLAARGYLTIEQIEGKKLLFLSDKDYIFTRTNPPPAEKAPLLAHEDRFISGIFGTLSTVRLSSLKERFYQNIPDMKRDVYGRLVDRNLFKSNPQTVRTAWTFLGILMLVGGFFLANFLKDMGMVAYGIGVLLAGVVFVSIARAMPAKTALGTRKLIECQSFQRFVKMVEKDRIREMSMKDPTIFGRLLSYAMVLGVADQWAEAFRGLTIPAPNWYVSSGGYPFNPILFTNDLGGGMRTMQKTFTSTPPKTSSSSGAGGGFSGFSSGGGFSGGGFGGGGGGSW
ncbi:MAG TPA: DUF2207 domain-containing protein [Tepidisphaeraceae bacterium]|nr:DUF2207 domain-containing protein [Tepidisphaeraceae bacterium]